jgi:hypothetical protein
VSDDAKLAALLSCALAEEGTYLPVIDGPRMQRPDGRNEVVRRTNAIARVQPNAVFLAGLSPEGLAAIAPKVPRRMQVRVNGTEDFPPHLKERFAATKPVQWGSGQLAVGLLKALRAGTLIEFHEGASPFETIPTKSGHVVVCEAGEDMSEIMAANYAFALGAGLKVIPAMPEKVATEIMDRLYLLYESGDPHAAFQAVRAELKQLSGEVEIPEDGSLTFFSRMLPMGIAFPQFPSTHMFTYPDLGVALINGFAAEQPGTSGVNVAVLVDPQTTSAGEIEPAIEDLVKRRTFVRVHRGAGADVSEVSNTVDLYPYDLLVFATHCGDASGYRWTYKYADSEGIDRTLVVDIALGVGQTNDPDTLAVTEFIRFHALDGVDWNGPEKAALYVGKAILDFMEFKKDKDFKPVARENIGRVLGSAAMRMNDGNYLPLPRSLANEQAPIIINNACVSWHELAGRFMFANARAYVGTLVDVNTMVAREIVPLLVGKYYGMPLAEALWAAQKDVFGDVERQPYVMNGVYTQALRAEKQDTPALILEKLKTANAHWTSATEAHRKMGDAEAAERTNLIVDYYTAELAAFGKRMAELEVVSAG